MWNLQRGSTIKCMKCENGPTHVLAFFGSKIENDLSVGGWTFGSLLGDEVD